MDENKEGKYCSVCGGVVPGSIKIRKILVDGKETGIDQLDMILEQVKRLHLKDDEQIKEELLKRARVFNYIPSKKIEFYTAALMDEYKKWKAERPDRQ